MGEIDFKEVSPKKVLTGAWGAIYDFMSKDIADYVTMKLVPLEVISIAEVRRCSSSSSELLQTLNRRSPKQVANALNVICDDPTAIEVRHIIEKTIAKEMEKGVKASISNPTVDTIKTEAFAKKLTAAIIDTPSFYEHWVELGSTLGLKDRELDQFAHDKRLRIQEFPIIIGKLVTSWIQTQGAKSEKELSEEFCKCLQETGLICARDVVMEKFGLVGNN